MDDPVQPQTPAAAPAPVRRSVLGKIVAELKHLPAWTRRNPVRAGITCLFIVLVPTCLVLLVWLMMPSEAATSVTVDQALQALDAGDRAEARRIAAEARSASKLSYHDMGRVFFVMGMAIARDAEERWSPEERRLLYMVAAKHLEEAKVHDFPEERETEGNFELGRSWHLAGEFEKSIVPLTYALQNKSPRATEARQLLSESYLRLATPNYELARKYNAEYLDDSSLDPLSRQEGILRECRIRFGLRDLAGCRRFLEQFPPESRFAPDLAIVKAKLLIAEAEALLSADPPRDQEARAALEQAIATLRSAPNKDPLVSAPPASAQYLLGICYQRIGDAEAAEAQFERVRRQHPESPEHAAAALQGAELLAGKKSYTEAVELVRIALEEGEASSSAPNPWLTPGDMERRVSGLHRMLLDAGEYDAALELADSPSGILPAWQLSLWRAATYEARSAAAERGAESLPLTKALQLRAKARADRREAGREYASLAELRELTVDYTEDLWKSAEQFSAGRDYPRAIAMTRKYLRNESRKRRPDALLLLGEAQLALDQPDQALESLSECLESFPTHPATYRARIAAALASAEKGLLAEAKQLLADNVDNDELSPRAAEWRDSLFLLGKLLHREGTELEAKSRATGVDSDDPDRLRAGLRELEQAHTDFRAAIAQLSKAVLRYPEAAQAKEAQYLLADSYRQASKWPRKRLKVVAIEASRAGLTRQSNQDLQAAVSEYDKLIAQLGDVQDSPNHTDLEKGILRNGYFAKADALFDLGRYEDAIKAYSNATNRYQNEPESLEAFVQIAACYRLLDKPGEARGTLEQAKVVLSRMKPDANFMRATPYTRDEWRQLLTWLATL